MNPTKPQILSLYRQLLKTSKTLQAYNIQQYGLRRTKDGFRLNQHQTDPNLILQLYQEGQKNLQILHRQAIIYNLYAPGKLVIEK